MHIVINPGHAWNTPGKCSPDHKLKEWEWNLKTAERLLDKLKAIGVSCELARANDEKYSLTTPVKLENLASQIHGKTHTVFVSIHVNAAGNGQWKNARGWSVWTTRGNTKADFLAKLLYDEAKKEFTDLSVRADMSDGDPDYESDFYVLRKTKCPAVLIENFFMDNKDDLAFLLTDESHERCADVVVRALKVYEKSLPR